MDQQLNSGNDLHITLPSSSTNRHLLRRDYRAILFDLDGTLIDSRQVWISAYRDLLQKCGHDLSDHEIESECLYKGSSSLGERFGLRNVEQFGKNLRERVEQGYAYAKPLPFASESVLLCVKRGLRVGLVSSAHGKIVSLGIKLLNLDGVFDVVVSGDDVDRWKPDPTPILRAIDRLSVQPREVIYVGDQGHDIEAARAAGSDMILYQDQLAPPQSSRHSTAFVPSIVISSHQELITLISGLSPGPEPYQK